MNSGVLMDAAALAVEGILDVGPTLCRARPPKSRVAYAAVGLRDAALRPSLPGSLPALGGGGRRGDEEGTIGPFAGERRVRTRVQEFGMGTLEEGRERRGRPGRAPQGDLNLSSCRVRTREKDEPTRDPRSDHVSAFPGLHRVRARG